MKKIAASIGLVAVGTASLQAAYAPGLDSTQTSKVWSLSGTLRGFYDDNYNTAPSGPGKRGSFGFEASPSISLNVPLDQTDIGARYTYGLYFYQDRESQGENPVDQTHQFDLWVNHAFTESWQASLQDSFVIAQDPDLLTSGGDLQRVKGDNIQNIGTIKLNTQWTRLLGSEFGYQNTFVDYSDNSGVTGPSPAALLNRDENLVWTDLSWKLTPEIAPLIGFKFNQVNYTGNGILSVAPITNVSDNRNSRSYFVYGGAQYNPLDNLSISVQAGIQYIDYYNPPAGLSANNELDPYADLSATYTYLPGSYLQVGFTQAHSATDVAAPNAAGQITQDLSSSTGYASLNHQFSPKLTGSLIGKIQYSTFNGGADNNDSQTWVSVGLNLSYSFNDYWSSEIGYNYDDLSSDVSGQSYNRNRVYIGVTATY